MNSNKPTYEELEQRIAELESRERLKRNSNTASTNLDISTKSPLFMDVLFDSILSGVIIVDAESRKIIDINSKALEMLARSKENVLQRECHKFICPAEGNALLQTSVRQ